MFQKSKNGFFFPMEAPKEKHQTLDPTENVDLPSDGTKIAEAEKLSDKDSVDLPKVSEGVSRVAPQFCIYCGQTLKGLFF